MTATFDVVCAGIIVVDHVAAPVDRLPDAGHLALTDECLLTIGGCASNVAVDLAKMKVNNTICGCVGDDLFGEFASRVLHSAGVDTTGLVTVPNTATAQTLVINVKGQDRRFIHHLGANRVFSGEHFRNDLIERAKLLYIGGLFLMDGLDPNDLADVFCRARQAGVITVLDVVTPGPKNYLEQLEIILPHTDYFLPNNDESLLMTSQSDPIAQAEVFRKLGAKTVVITCGQQGAILLSPTERLRSKSFPVQFVDGTGGGDAFDAGFICGLLENASPRRCLEIGSALGASCVQRPGATSGVFTREEAEKFLETNRLEIEEI